MYGVNFASVSCSYLHRIFQTFQPAVQDVVESKVNVHYLIDFEEGSPVDQIDR